MADREVAPTRAALDELLRTIEEVDADYLGALSGEELAVGHRALMHLLGAGLDMFFDTDAREPSFRRAHWADRKFFGDNADCIYYVAQIDPAFEYRIRGNIAGAAYTSFTVEGAASTSAIRRLGSSRRCTTVSSTWAVTGATSSSASAEPQEGNWLALEADAASISTRHYFEQVEPVAADPLEHIPLTIDAVGSAPDAPSTRGVGRARHPAPVDVHPWPHARHRAPARCTGPGGRAAAQPVQPARGMERGAATARSTSST